MSLYYGNGFWYESDEEDPRMAQGAQPGRSAGGDHSSGFNPNAYGGNYPSSRSCRTPQPFQGRYDTYDDRDEDPRRRTGRRAGGSSYGQTAWSDDEYDELRCQPSRPRANQSPERSRQAPMGYGTQGSRSFLLSPNSDSNRRGVIYCPNDIHVGLENHMLGQQGGVEFWDSRRAAEIAAQCAEQCDRHPREFRQLRQVGSGVWSLTYSTGNQGRRTGDGARRGEERRYEERQGGDRRGERRGGRRPSNGGAEIWYS